MSLPGKAELVVAVAAGAAPFNATELAALWLESEAELIGSVPGIKPPQALSTLRPSINKRNLMQPITMSSLGSFPEAAQLQQKHRRQD
jgi:hypothetical protein